MTSTDLLISSYSNNNNYVNLHDVTNLGLYNKLILVTQEQVLEFYITVIECKILNGHQTLSQHFPNVTSNTYHLSNATNRPYVQDIEETRLFTIAAEPEAGISTYHQLIRQTKLSKYYKP